MTELAVVAALTRDTLREFADGLQKLSDVLDGALATPTGDWHFPVGSEQFPVEQWYAALLHDTTGRRNVAIAGRSWPHTGIDLNVQTWPRGDIDRNQPVWAVADGVVDGKAYSANYLASVVILVEHEGQPLYVRHWHLNKDMLYTTLAVGQRVRAGDCLGTLGNYRMGAGGDHDHFDMALDPFEPLWWFTRHKSVRWVDPVPILKAHLDPVTVDAMLSKR